MQEHGPPAAGTAATSGLVDGRVVDRRLAPAAAARQPRPRRARRPHGPAGRRRRGYATAMLAHLERGRPRPRPHRSIFGEASWPYAAGPYGRGQPGPEFARARRLRPRARRRQATARRCRWPTSCSTSSRLRRPPHHDGVHAALVGRPGARRAGRRLGPARRQPDDRGADRRARHRAGVRRRRRPSARARRCSPRRAARSTTPSRSTPTASVVAYTDLATTVHEPGKAYQWGTLVRARRPRPPARAGGQGRQPAAAPARAARRTRADHLQRRGQRAHDRRQRAARLRAGRSARGVPEAARSQTSERAPPADGRRAGQPVEPQAPACVSGRRQGRSGGSGLGRRRRPSRG